MKKKRASHFTRYILLFTLLLSGGMSFAQFSNTQQPGSLNRPQKDTSKTNTNQWRDEAVNITYQKLNSEKVYVPDTSLHTFHRVPFRQPWYNDLGNHGSPVNNLFFTPEYRVGPTLGYHIFDVYRYDVDSVKFYTTSRPYSAFGYMLGSKLEQTASIMHTQNIKPNWNIAVEYRKINSPGFYKIQRNNHDNAFLSTNYKSLNKHYTLNAAMVYNKEQHDENGGLRIPGQLDSSDVYSDRKTIGVAYQNEQYSSTRSTVSNMQRDFTFLLQHSYTWGNTDTTYNEDSTQYSYALKPLFSISHKMEISSEKHVYKDLAPDSFRYDPLFAKSFISKGLDNVYQAGSDSVLVQQKWFWADNQLMLNGFIGKQGRQLKFSVGAGNRFDQFVAQPVANIIKDSLPLLRYNIGYERNTIVSNYLAGEIKKEALHAGEWEYIANTKLFVTGENAGNFVFNAQLGKELKNILGSFLGGFQQQLNTAPYSYRSYENAYTKRSFSFDNESVTMIHASMVSPRFKVAFGLKNYVINNYIYLNENQLPDQYATAFNITQVWLNKVFRFGLFVLDNNIVYQQTTGSAPVNFPAILGRHQFSYESALFKSKLKIATGIEVRYNTAYNPAGYDALFNRFYYQQKLYTTNLPEASVFFNFRIKRFRAFIVGDYLQQLLLGKNTILYAATPMRGYNLYPAYGGQNFTIRFGFSWPLVN